jgi:ribosome biogenesis GTPase
MDLDQLGWRGGQETIEAYRSGGETLGRVAVEHRGCYVVYTEVGELLALISGRFWHDSQRDETITRPAVGDWVALRARPGDERATISAVLPRTSYFARKVAGRTTEIQVVAANVDLVFLVSALDGDLNPRRLERYLALACAGGVEPVIVLNKADLCADVPAALTRVAAATARVETIVVSARAGQGLDDLEIRLRAGRTAAFMGSSGVGKSTLINRLLGCDAQAAGDLRGDGKGRHTTTRRELLPLPGGGLVIDTPGMRELQLWESDDGVGEAFVEVEDLAAECRFADCAHKGEPGCAVQAAVARGTLPAERLASFHKLQAELRYLDGRRDGRRRVEEKRLGKIANRTPNGLKHKRWR